ncbi:acyl carrier protein [Dactylosporangium sp. CA-092794]|uniref:acyl carrier protein n=1 Tax=Dactylosporangium sp. CA-092794 TaxID=3239929 RepID=UPI003D92A458
MTEGTEHMPAGQSDILADIAEMLHAIRDDLEAEDVTMDATFRTDLGVESIDVVALAGRLQSRYGDGVNFAEFVAGLGLDSVRDLRVRELVEFIETSLSGKAVAA